MKIVKEEKPLSYLKLFRYATSLDRLLILIGTLCSMTVGTSLPIMTIVFGDIMNGFFLYDGSDASKEYINTNTTKGVVWMSVIGL